MSTSANTRGIPAIALNDGRSIPQLGFGVFKVPDESCKDIVLAAIDSGYRLLDTAAIYRNEEGVGDALRESSVAREALFVTTKLWNSAQGYDSAMVAVEQSLKKLQTSYVDLYLIHWPAPRQDKYVDSWKALIEIQRQGLAKSIGVSNFTVANLDRIIQETGVVPAINQIELHPVFQQRELREYHAKHGVITESWGPLGQGNIPERSVLDEIAIKYGKSIAQVMLRWQMDSGIVAIPKTSSKERMLQNIDVFDFTLDADDMTKIASMDRGDGRGGPDPDLATF